MNRFLFSAILFLLSIWTSSAQRYNFVNYSVEDGLPQSQIYAIYQDNEGYLWLGTNGGGVCRFDGTTFNTFNDENGLHCGFVRCLGQTVGGTLLAGTEDGLYYMSSGKLIQYTNPNFSCNVAIRGIECDDRNVWVATYDQGIYLYKDGIIKHITSTDGLPEDNINTIFLDSQNRLWIGTEKGFCVLKDDSIYSINDPSLSSFLSIRSFSEDKNGNIWIASYINGIACYNGKDFKRYNASQGLCSNTVFSVFCDTKGNLWVGTALGVSKFSNHEFHNITTTEGLCSNVIVAIMEDSENNIWFGSSGGGISRFDNERFIHFPEDDNIGKLIYAIDQDAAFNMWFATSLGGVTKYDGKVYKIFDGKSGFTSEKIKTIYCDKDSTIWFGSSGKGAYLFDGISFKRFSYKDGLCGNFISAIDKDNKGNIWFSSLDNGIGYYHPETGTFLRYRKKNGLKADRVNTIRCTHNGNVWVGLANAGIAGVNLSGKDSSIITVVNYDMSNGLSSNNINALLVKGEKLYVGTSGGGLDLIDASGKIHIYGKKNGLSSNMIYSLVMDPFGNLWAGSEKGVDKIVFRGDSILHVSHYGKAEGFIGVENTLNSAFLAADSNLWFGTINGINRYNPAYDNKNNTAPKIYLTSANLFFDDILETDYGKDYPTLKSLSGKLILPSDKNNLSFSFNGINFRNPVAVRYKWKLEGFDKEWTPALENKDATYSNIPPGDYTFMVNACDENGNWSKTPATFSFTITSPYWAKTWFIISSILFVLFLSWLGIQLRFRVIKSRNRDEQQKLKLSKSILELQQATSRLQMNPHFIFNSLNSIQGYIADNNTTQAKWYLSKFAKLMRLILENATEEFILLKDEVSILENYLVLEKMRMNDKFDFTIEANENCDPESIEIPPMIIQPFVENAILHGLKHKEGKGELNINFSLIENVLVCTVRDNGIGRKTALELKNKSSAEHKSSAIQITNERLKRLSEEFKADAGVEITDIFDETGKAAGTKIEIRIPVETN